MSRIGDTREYLERCQNARLAARLPRSQEPGRSQNDDLKIFPVHLIPERLTPVFIGREDILNEMSQYFQREPGSRSVSAVYTLHGIGGVGKTELARAYAHRFKDKLDAVFWVGAESKPLVQAAFARIAVELNIDGAKITGDPASNRDLVLHWFRKERMSRSSFSLSSTLAHTYELITDSMVCSYQRETGY